MKKSITFLLSFMCFWAPLNHAQTLSDSMKPGKPSDPSFDTEDIYIQSLGKKLYGLACIPKNGPEKKPTVIMSHGYKGTSARFYEQMTELAKKGYICFALDLQGACEESKSEGSTTEMSIFTEKQNLLDALDEVMKWDFVDTGNIFLCGESQGGCVSAMAAAEVRDKIKAIALVYPGFCIPDDARRFYKTKEEIPETVNFMGVKRGRMYFADSYDFDVYSVIPAFKKDVLIVHGDADELVDISYSEKAARLYENCEFHVIPGAGHSYKGEYKILSNKYISDFFERETIRQL